MSRKENEWREIRATGILQKWPVCLLASTASTNTAGLEMGRQGAASGTVVLTDRQTGGRGRLGKNWASPPGGLYFSLILRPHLAAIDTPKITIAAGLGVCNAVYEDTGLKPLIKWPNDLLLNGKKFSGILCETDDPYSSGPPLVVIGVGINVNTRISDFPTDLQSRITSLSESSGAVFSRKDLLLSVLRQLENVIFRLEQGDFAGILDEWRARDACRDTLMTWLTPQGKVISGIALGPDRNGILHIRDDSGKIHEVLSGDLEINGKRSQDTKSARAQGVRHSQP